MNPQFQMCSSPAGAPFWSGDLAKNRPECSVDLRVVARLQRVVKKQWLTLVRSSWQTNYVGTVNSIQCLDTLNKAKGRKTWLRFFMIPNASLLHLPLSSFSGRKAKSSSFSWLAELVSSPCWARLREEIKCTQQALLVLWGSEMRSQVATRDEYKC